MEKTQTFQTIISLNTQEAKNEIADLEKRLEVLKKKKADALRNPETLVKDINKFDKEIKAAEASLKAYGNNVSKTIETINNLETASLGDIEKAAREVRRAMKQATTVEEYNKLNRYLQDCKDRMDELKASSIQSKKELQALDQAADNLKNVLGNVDGASLNELTAAATLLQQKLGDIKPDSTAYHETAENISKIRSRIKQLSASQKEANLTIDKYDEEIKAACKSSRDLERENKLINETLKNITGSSLRDLQYSLKIVNERLADQKQGTAAFEDLTDHAKKLKAQIAAINGEQEKSESLFGKTANFLNKNWGAITQTIAAFSGLSANVRQCVDAYTEMDQEMNNVRKYTGQSMEEVMEMNEDFKKIDTRTPRKHLNELAESAGRLGITSKDSIEEFVDAADKISVALGDDLGDDAIDKVGKLAMAFGEDDRLGLRGAMLATGSAINELAQNSSASAGYLVEFTARVAGVGKQVGLTQAQIMGFGAVMDENMQKDEMASTAFSQLLTKMSTDTKTFAKMAGVDLKTFSNLVKTDINTAVLTLMDNLKSKGGFDQLGKMFGDMGLDGTRAVAVLSTMADKIDDVRSRQEIATNAYKEATSVIEEFDVQNTTIQGDIEKAKNRFHELAIELGEKLLPVVKYSISTGGIAIKLLSVATSFTLKYWRVIVVLASGIVAYTLVVKAEAIAEKAATAAKMASAAADKLKAVRTAFAASAQEAYNIAVKVGTRQITLATAAQQLWNKAILANPYSAILATMVAVTATLVAFTSKADKATKAQRELNEANEEAAADCRSEVAELSSLVKLAQDKSSSDEVRKEAIKKLQEKYPGYLDNLNLENIYSNNARKAVDNLTDSILAQAKARVYLSKVEELEREKQNVNEEYLNDWWGKMSHTFTSQFQALANNIAHYAEKGYNAVSQGVGNWQFNRGLKPEFGIRMSESQSCNKPRFIIPPQV
jgi:TP901 family phage tail tape measure protein